ncbi:SDR family NAD(P)-dependent oxidoreductase [Sphingorhabdus sp. Alg231-15]|uniref:SDR family NAD(P)-dependent oxidoreductase n=1 Tax=Sphingorhabdus sp. Alg231-15 TaxID=1922222 RepID=UPI000D54F5B3
MNSRKPICFITGVGPGTGTAIARRFAKAGYRLALNARDADRLTKLAQEFDDSIVLAADISEPKARQDMLDDLFQYGVPEVVVNNAVGGTFGTYLEIDPDDLARNFSVNVEAMLALARGIIPHMVDRGKGAFLATGNSSAYRGKPNFAGFAPTKAAQRILLESIARTVGPQGVHCAYVAIDAVIDLEWTRKMAPDKPDEFFCLPDDIAEEVFRIASQKRSAWSFDTIIRPFGEGW